MHSASPAAEIVPTGQAPHAANDVGALPAAQLLHPLPVSACPAGQLASHPDTVMDVPALPVQMVPLILSIPPRHLVLERQLWSAAASQLGLLIAVASAMLSTALNA